MTISYIGVRDEYAPKFGRQALTLWTGGFASDFVGHALELPGHDGYMLTIGLDKVRVECEAPRTDANYERVDAAIEGAVKAYYAARTPEDEDNDAPDDLCGLCGVRRAAAGHTACSTCA